MKHQINIVLAAATLIVASDGFAHPQMQSPSVQASRGQSQAQQSRDTDRCNTMARKETGVDPISIAANATPLQPGKGITSTPIEAPSTAMGASAAGTTAAGTGDMGAGQQMGSSASGQMNNSGTGQMGNTSSSEMSSAGSGQMQTGTGQTVNSSNAQMANAGTPQTGTATSNSNWASGTSSAGATGSSSMGASASGATGSSGTTMAMADSAEDYNRAFSRCMSSRGYVVGSTSQ